MVTPGSPQSWAAVIALYREAFNAAEREPEGTVAERAASGRYRVHAAVDDSGRPIGFAIVDRVAAPCYAVLTYLAVCRSARRAGLGGWLAGACRAAVADRPLFVEASERLAGFYRRLGFRALAVAYATPRQGGGSAPARLLVSNAALPLTGTYLREVVAHMFGDGYGLAASDELLNSQLRIIPDKVGEAGDPTPPGAEIGGP